MSEMLEEKVVTTKRLVFVRSDENKEDENTVKAIEKRKITIEYVRGEKYMKNGRYQNIVDLITGV